MANYSLLLAIMIMVSINVGLGLYDYGIGSYAPDYDSQIDFSHTPADKMLIGGINGTADLDTSLAVPESSDSFLVDVKNYFTDVFKTISNWFNTIDSALGVMSSVLTQPMGFLHDIGVPAVFYNAFGVIWYLMLLFLIVAFIKGGGVD